MYPLGSKLYLKGVEGVYLLFSYCDIVDDEIYLSMIY